MPLLGCPQTRPACFACQVVVESQLCRARGNLDPGCQMKGVSALLPQSLHGVVEAALLQDYYLTSVCSTLDCSPQAPLSMGFPMEKEMTTHTSILACKRVGHNSATEQQQQNNI